MADKEQLVVTHDGIEVAYDEDANVWRFTLRGRERSAESLAKAKEAIDKPVPADKAKPFERVKAIMVGYNGDVTFGEVTSLADSPSYRSQEAWFLSAKGGRSKEDISRLCADNEKNRQLVAEGLALDKEAASLTKKAEAKRNKMDHLKIVVPE